MEGGLIRRELKVIRLPLRSLEDVGGHALRKASPVKRKSSLENRNGTTKKTSHQAKQSYSKGEVLGSKAHDAIKTLRERLTQPRFAKSSTRGQMAKEKARGNARSIGDSSQEAAEDALGFCET